MRKARSFTLIEMLIAATIFVTVIVVTAGIFGSSSQLQTASGVAMRNQQYAGQISDRLFEDLKLQTGWGTVEASIPTGGPSRKFQVKGFAILELNSSKLTYYKNINSFSVPDASKANLIISFRDNGANVMAIFYYFDQFNKKFYRGEREYQKIDIVLDDIPSLPVTAGNLPSFDEIKADQVRVKSFKLAGSNFVSREVASDISDSTGRIQPIVKYQIIVEALDQLGNQIKNEYEIEGAVASRNYSEE